MTYPPFTFGNQSGSVAASELDDNFNAALNASAVALTVKGNSTGSTANAGDVDMPTLYGMLKSAIPWEFTAFVGGTPGNSWQVGRYQPTTGLSIVQASCLASAGVAATASTTFVLSKNGSNIGTITFAIGGTAGTIAISGTPVAVAIGDKIVITSPGTADATLADINFTLGGVRT